MGGGQRCEQQSDHDTYIPAFTCASAKKWHFFAGACVEQSASTDRCLWQWVRLALREELIWKRCIQVRPLAPCVCVIEGGGLGGPVAASRCYVGPIHHDD